MNIESADVAPQRYLGLQHRRRATGRATDELLHLYALEGIYRRLRADGWAVRWVKTSLRGGSRVFGLGGRRR